MESTRSVGRARLLDSVLDDGISNAPNPTCPTPRREVVAIRIMVRLENWAGCTEDQRRLTSMHSSGIPCSRTVPSLSSLQSLVKTPANAATTSLPLLNSRCEYSSRASAYCTKRTLLSPGYLLVSSLRQIMGSATLSQALLHSICDWYIVCTARVSRI